MPRPRSSLLLCATAALAVLTTACDTNDGRTLREPTSDQRVEATNAAATTTTTIAPGSSGFTDPVVTAAPTTPSIPAAPFILTAPWEDGGPIDVRYTCDGPDLSPPLSWTAPPPGTAELAIVMSDDDAAFRHWAVVGLAPQAGALDEGQVPEGVIEAVNDFAAPGWDGPCPPAGPAHTYRFQLYALTAPADVPVDADLDAIVASIEGLQQAVAVVTGTYQRA